MDYQFENIYILIRNFYLTILRYKGNFKHAFMVVLSDFIYYSEVDIFMECSNTCYIMPK